MDDWKGKINRKFAQHEVKRAEIHSALNQLIIELKREPAIKSGGIDLVELYPLSWKVVVNQREIIITENEIDDARLGYDENLNSTDDVGELVPALEKLLVSKFR